jgi:hypothetical protein
MIKPKKLKLYTITVLEFRHVVGFIKTDGSILTIPPTITKSTPLTKLPNTIKYMSLGCPTVYAGDNEAIIKITGSQYIIRNVYTMFVEPKVKNMLPIRIWMSDMCLLDKGGENMKPIPHIAMFGSLDWSRIFDIYDNVEESYPSTKFYCPTDTNPEDLLFIKSRNGDSCDIARECLGSRTEYCTFTQKEGTLSWIIVEWESITEPSVHYYTINDMTIRTDSVEPIIGENGSIKKGKFTNTLRKLKLLK